MTKTVGFCSPFTPGPVFQLHPPALVHVCRKVKELVARACVAELLQMESLGPQNTPRTTSARFEIMLAKLLFPKFEAEPLV